MTKLRTALLLMLAPALYGCASFNSGDIKVDRDTARSMLQEKDVTPFRSIEVSWQYFPYRSASDSIGEGSVSRPKVRKPVQVNPEDAVKLREKAREIFAQAGLLDKNKGSGVLRIELTSFNRWTSRDLFRSFLVDTGFIFIIPASLRVNHYMTADFSVSGAPVRVETEARNKTTFHLLMAPLYPFFSPGAKEGSLLRQMLWRSATDVYLKLKESGGTAGQLPPKDPEEEEARQPLSGPPIEPDRTWLPGDASEDAQQGTPAPEPPSQTWSVPPDSTSQPAAPGAKPQEPSAPATAQPAAEETPDD